MCEEHNHFCYCYKTHNQLTHIWKWKRRQRCDGEKGRLKRERQTGREAGRKGVSGTEGGNIRMKESRWHRQQNEQVIEVKWEQEQEGEKRRGDLREIKHGLRAAEVRLQTSVLWQPAGTSPADRLCCFPICSEERQSPTWGRMKVSGWDCLRQIKQGVFLMPSRADKSLISCFACDTKGCCVVCWTVQGFLVVGAVNN